MSRADDINPTHRLTDEQREDLKHLVSSDDVPGEIRRWARSILDQDEEVSS